MRLPVLQLKPQTARRQTMHSEATDPYLWLEDIHGSNAMDWVKAQNVKSKDASGRSRFIGKIMIPFSKVWMQPTVFGGNLDHNYIFNFWQDAHIQGYWRRTTIADYTNAQPHLGNAGRR